MLNPCPGEIPSSYTVKDWPKLLNFMLYLMEVMEGFSGHMWVQIYDDIPSLFEFLIDYPRIDESRAYPQFASTYGYFCKCVL